MADKDELGRAGENRAAQHLRERGDVILDRNWRCPVGEVDIVSQRGGALCFVEVKTRRTAEYGYPFDAVTERKRTRMWKVALAWAVDHPELVRGLRWQLDVIAIVGSEPATASVEHLEDLA